MNDTSIKLDWQMFVDLFYDMTKTVNSNKEIERR